MEIKKLGRYEILSELGQGAMGVVYKAVDPLIDRTVAIKTINLSLSKDELADFEDRFNREAKSAGRLSHPNIVTIYDVGRADRAAFMAMEYLEGRELKEIIASGEVLPPDRIAELIAQVADGLAFAHDHGIVHRDIKPANIMVLRNGNVKITDFGIAKMSSSSRTQVGIVLGSPKYMSPEQVAGKAVDGRSDIFSLGAVLYELLTGRPAFGGEDNTLASIMYRVMNETPALPTSVNPAIPSGFDYIAARALAKEPENRYQSAREMANDLRNHKNLAVTAPPSAAQAGKAAASSGGNKAGDDGEATLVMRAMQPRGSALGWKLAGAAVVLLVAAAVVVGSGREPAARDARPAAVAIAPQPPAIAESRAPAATLQDGGKPAAPPPSQASLAFSVLPWGEVFVDGKSQGASPPLREIKVSAGKHRIEIKNADFPPYLQTVDLETGASKKIQHQFK